mgnify:CR=1 FL=1
MKIGIISPHSHSHSRSHSYFSFSFSFIFIKHFPLLSLIYSIPNYIPQLEVNYDFDPDLKTPKRVSHSTSTPSPSPSSSSSSSSTKRTSNEKKKKKTNSKEASKSSRAAEYKMMVGMFFLDRLDIRVANVQIGFYSPSLWYSSLSS